MKNRDDKISIYKPDVKSDFLYCGNFLQGNATHQRNLLLRCMVKFVNWNVRIWHKTSELLFLGDGVWTSESQFYFIYF